MDTCCFSHISTSFSFRKPLFATPCKYDGEREETANQSAQSKCAHSSESELSHVRLFVMPWTAARQASLSFAISQNLLKFMSIESVMPSSHLILCRPLLLLPSIFPSIRVFSNESVLRSRGPKCWRFSFSILPSNEY